MGGFGVVDEVVRIDADGRSMSGALAMKSLKPEYAHNAEVRARFVREVRLQDELDHPNVMQIVGRNLSADPPYFLMPLAESNLRARLREGFAGQRDWLVPVFLQILEGVAHAHGRSREGEPETGQRGPVVHRDLKPDNILFVDDVPRVADFGLGKRLDADDSGLTRTHVFMGTEPYAAPEQFSSTKDVGPPADVYALGKLLWEMLTGTEPEVLHVELEAVPREFRWFLAKCTRRRPDERYPNASEALQAFRQFLSSPQLVGSPIEAAERLVAQWATGESEKARIAAVRSLDDLLQRSAGEEELFFKAVPRLPDELLALYVAELPEPFGEMLSIYDEHISGGLPFAYCDIVADFYSQIWTISGDVDVQRRVLARLISVGASHNRWHVGDVVCRLLLKVDDVSTATMAAEVIRADPGHAEWFWSWFEKRALANPIADAFAEVIQ